MSTMHGIWMYTLSQTFRRITYICIICFLKFCHLGLCVDMKLTFHHLKLLVNSTCCFIFPTERAINDHACLIPQNKLYLYRVPKCLNTQLDVQCTPYALWTMHSAMMLSAPLLLFTITGLDKWVEPVQSTADSNIPACTLNWTLNYDIQK